jgi:hypothetical protein
MTLVCMSHLVGETRRKVRIKNDANDSRILMTDDANLAVVTKMTASKSNLVSGGSRLNARNAGPATLHRIGIQWYRSEPLGSSMRVKSQCRTSASRLVLMMQDHS